jgi:hypothetical protein
MGMWYGMRYTTGIDAGRRVRLLLLFAVLCIRYCLYVQSSPVHTQFPFHLSSSLSSPLRTSHTNNTTPTLTGRTAIDPSTSATQETPPSTPPIGPSTNKETPETQPKHQGVHTPRKIEHHFTPCENRAGWMGWHASLGDWLCNRLHGGVGIVADPWHGGSCDVGV